MGRLHRINHFSTTHKHWQKSPTYSLCLGNNAVYTPGPRVGNYVILLSPATHAEARSHYKLRQSTPVSNNSLAAGMRPAAVNVLETPHRLCAQQALCVGSDVEGNSYFRLQGHVRLVNMLLARFIKMFVDAELRETCCIDVSLGVIMHTLMLCHSCSRSFQQQQFRSDLHKSPTYSK